MRNALITGIILLTILTVWMRLTRPAKEASTEESPTPPPEPKAKVAEQPHATLPVVTRPSAVPTEKPRTNLSQQAQEQLALSTPEAKQVEAVLANHGWPTNALPAAYGYAYEFHRVGGVIGDGSIGANQHIELLLRHHKWRLERFGQPTPELLTNLLAIHPTVFWPKPSTGGMPVFPK